MAHDPGAKTFTVTLSISKADYERLYRGQARTVLARDSQGTTLQFPALSLRQFLSHDGIHGTFVIRVNNNNRLLDIRRQGG
ncbi:MAG: DUF2835 domain-containing protein [Thiogranum sp.]|jgi:hypothetical protein|nr:DUF2835 domain-containing protein [Thiogranum sp.]